MPPRLRLIGRYGNGALALINAVFVPFAVAEGSFSVALAFLAVAVLGCFNIYVVEKAAAATSEEEWLKAEIRKAELRRKLADLTGDPAAPHALPAPSAHTACSVPEAPRQP